MFLPPPHPSIHTKTRNLRINPETEHPQGLSLSVFKTLFSLSLFPNPAGLLFCFRPMAAASSRHTNTKVTFGRPLSTKGSLYCFPAQRPSLAQLHSSLVPLSPSCTLPGPVCGPPTVQARSLQTTVHQPIPSHRLLL